MDICEPMSMISLGGNRYFLILIDDFSRKCWVYFLKNKGEAFDIFRKFHVMDERETGRKLKTLRSDRGGEFIAYAFKGIL